jgi:hypothetical protein
MEGAKSGRGRLRQIKRGRGINGRDDKSRGIEILMTEAFAFRVYFFVFFS